MKCTQQYMPPPPLKYLDTASIFVSNVSDENDVFTFCFAVWDVDRIITIPRERSQGNNGAYSQVRKELD